MEVIEEFRSLGALFHQDADLYVDMNDEHAVVAYVLDDLDAASQVALKEFLAKLLRKKLSAKQLGRLWLSTGTDYHFGRLRQFLTLIHDAIPD